MIFKNLIIATMILKHKISYFKIKIHGKQTSFLALRKESCKSTNVFLQLYLCVYSISSELAKMILIELYFLML